MIVRNLYFVCLPIATGILLALSMPPVDWSWLVWIALVPIGLAITEKRGQFELYLGAYAAGAIFQWIHCDWIRTVTSGTTLSYNRQIQWMAQGLVLALPWPVMLWVGRILMRRRYACVVVVLPLIWVAFEYMRFNEGWLFDRTGYPWGQIGFALHDYPRLMQVASLGGVFGVGALVAMVNGAIVDRLRGILSGGPILAAALILCLCAAYGQWQLGQQFCDGPTICLMPEGSEHNKLATTADILLWSEASYVRVADVEQKEIGLLQAKADHSGATLVVGCTRQENGNSFNSVAVIVPHRAFQGFYDKIMLVPFSEFHPRHMPARDEHGRSRFKHGSSYPSFDIGSWRLAALICYDVCFPMTVRQFMLGLDQPDFFVVPSYEAHDISGCVQRLTVRHTQFRAIECRRSIVRNVVGGVSGIIDGNGRIVTAFNSIPTPTSAGTAVPIDDRHSLYAAWGDWLPRGCIIAVIVILCGIVWQGSGRRRRRPSTKQAQ